MLYAGKQNGRDATEVKAGYGEAALKLRARKGSWGDAYGELRFRTGLLDREVQHQLDLREAYVNAYLGPVDVRLGHQIIVWGRADAINPTNNLTPRDMRVRSPVEDDARLGNLALRAHLNLEPFRWELVWVPFFAPSHFPRFELPGGISLGQPDYPDANIKHGTLATRAHFLWPAFELSVSYLIGSSTFPGIKLLQVAPSPAGGLPLTSVAFTTYRHHVAGGDFSTTIGSFGVRGEVALRWPIDHQDAAYKPMPDLQYVVGLDHEFFHQVNVILQYSGRAVVDWVEDPTARGTPITSDPLREIARQLLAARNRIIAGQQERVQHSLTLRVEWKLLQETLSLEALGLVNISTEEALIRPRVTYDIADALSVCAGAEIYLGPNDTLFGLVEQIQSAGFAELRASF